ncbi:TPA_exp: Uncharacterized protein A8136_2405 [Trichophyton benhamiae CBS 112371]|uniref:NAD(P)-binding domain-containing protein n=1 Tax=Arthroderma benhamiae (strain ATCC MYA-4681 / CBS 112371) TaxID=663331 RepID=D4AM41_ARTBC|nr:uncharacterized protein ARB_04731 [Trichophyton benhamiae CBS 112371]EFE35797.1 conserved hypothetical protein [Trichophyton benhamiae CBS 112371]DAA78620.1 TPA_exp: Uncharacterized protein A8136_2405 [Trichophyton benhamiae CBS 112371]
MASPIAFIGSTGGCANSCLAHTLKGGYNVVALARTPSKLTDQLKVQGIEQSVIDKQLTVIQGDVNDIEAVKRTVAPACNNGALVPTIISGIGSTPKLQASIWQPVTLNDPNVCEKATNNIISAVKEVQSSHGSGMPKTQPFLTVVSTTGISKTEDVPLAFRPLYHYFLAVPHKDKLKMEEAIFNAVADPTPTCRVFRGVMSVRPSLLTGDYNIATGKGWKTLRVGTDDKPAVGYTIQRADVGEWMYHEVVANRGQNYTNQKVSLTS